MQILNDLRSHLTQIAQICLLISQPKITLIEFAALRLQPLPHVLAQRNGTLIDVSLCLLQGLVSSVSEVVIAHLGRKSLFGDLGLVEGFPVLQHLGWLLVLISQLYLPHIGGKYAFVDLGLVEFGGRGGEELLFIEGVFQEMWSLLIVLEFFVLAGVALVVGQVGWIELVLMQGSRGQLALLGRQVVRLQLRGRSDHLLLNCPVYSHEFRERVHQIAEFGRQVFVLLILPHAIDDLGIGLYLVLGNSFSDEFQQVALEGEDEFGEEGVVLFLVLARGEAAVYRHQTIIFLRKDKSKPDKWQKVRYDQTAGEGQIYKSSLKTTPNHPSRFPSSFSSPPIIHRSISFLKPPAGVLDYQTRSQFLLKLLKSQRIYMSRTAKPVTTSSKISKPAPTAWKDRLAAQDYDQLVNTFQVFDEDGSGTIDPVEINKVLEELGLDRRNPFILNLINGLKDKNKPIGLDEFIDIIASRVGETKTKDGIRRIFALYDKDQNGVVDFEEFKHIAKQLHDPINDDDLLQLLHSTHINQKTSTNEGFTFEEFYTVVSKFNNK